MQEFLEKSWEYMVERVDDQLKTRTIHHKMDSNLCYLEGKQNISNTKKNTRYNSSNPNISLWSAYFGM